MVSWLGKHGQDFGDSDDLVILDRILVMLVICLILMIRGTIFVILVFWGELRAARGSTIGIGGYRGAKTIETIVFSLKI